jgi:hypothetical protein
MPPRRQRSIWDLAILVLGLNLWVGFQLLPLLHLERPGPTKTTWLLALAAPLVLAAGVALRHRAALLAGFPLLLVVPAAVNRQLVGVNVYTPAAFVVVQLSFLAYLGVTLRLLQLFETPPVPEDQRPLREAQLGTRWRRRIRIYRWLAALAALLPLAISGTLFLHPGVQADLRAAYPNRAAEANAFFGVLSLALWLGVFYADFLVPLRAHVRGDPGLRGQLEQTRRAALRRRPRASFYLFVALALGLMAALILSRT